MLNGNFKYYFGLDCLKRFATDTKDIETQHKFENNKQMIFTEEDKLYYDTNNTCHILQKRINKVRDHCHETGNNRGTANNICNLRYNQQNFIPLYSIMALAIFSIYDIAILLIRIMTKEKWKRYH